MIKTASHQDWVDLEGKELGQSQWHTIDQEQINAFAKATLDFQWIHLDAEKAKESQFGSTIAHGYLTVSLLPYLMDQIIQTENSKMTVNYGIEELRFTTPVKVDQKVQLTATVKEVKNLRGISRVKLGVSLAVEGEKRPAYTGTIVFLYHFEA